MEDLDLDVSLPESVVVVEWGEGKVEELSEARLQVVIERTVGSSDRRRRGDVAASAGVGRTALGGADAGGVRASELGGTVRAGPGRLDRGGLRRRDGPSALGMYRQAVGKMLRWDRRPWSLDPGARLGLPTTSTARGGTMSAQRPPHAAGRPRGPATASPPRRRPADARPAGGARRGRGRRRRPRRDRRRGRARGGRGSAAPGASPRGEPPSGRPRRPGVPTVANCHIASPSARVVRMPPVFFAGSGAAASRRRPR